MITRNETQVVVIAHFTAKEGYEQEVLETLHSLLGPTRAEQGCIRYELNQSVENPGVFGFVERFANQAAFDAHLRMPYIVNFLERIAPTLLSSSSVSLYREVLP